jgi:DNA mismatch repair protein MLH1
LTGGIAEPEQSTSKKRKGKERARDEDDQGNAETVEPKTTSTPAREFVGPCSFVPITTIWQLAPKKTSSQYKVRTSLQDRTLESMFPVVNPTQIEGQSKGKSADTTKSREIKESQCNLTSVKKLRQNAIKGKHKRNAA